MSKEKNTKNNTKSNLESNKSNQLNSGHPSMSQEYSESDNYYTESENDTNLEKSKNSKNADDDEEIKKKARETYLQTDFVEKVIKYIKADNLIRKETTEFREKINTLKEEKQDLENFIIKYLDMQEENVVNITGSGKLTKYESIRKKSINKDIIQQTIYDQIKKEK